MDRIGGIEMNNTEWTIDDHNKSLSQGWMIIDNKELGCIRIIRNDDLEIFENDRQALKHVTKMANCGSKFHQKALKICGSDAFDSEDVFTMNIDEVKQAINQLEVYRNYFHLSEETFYSHPFKAMLQFHKEQQ